MLSNNSELVELIEAHAPDIADTKRRIDQFINNGTSTIEERTAMREIEEERLKEKSRLLVSKLRTTLLAE